MMMLKLFKKITISNRNLFIIQVCLHFFLQVSFPSELPLQAFLKFINNQGHYKKKRLRYVIIIRAMTLNEGLAINDVTPF